MSDTSFAIAASSTLRLHKIAAWRGVRALLWHGDVLYGCRGYQVVRLQVTAQISESVEWEGVARFRPAWWRNLTSRNRLSYRLVRDGFHALPMFGERNNETMVGAVPGALVTRAPHDNDFRVTHPVHRG